MNNDPTSRTFSTYRLAKYYTPRVCCSFHATAWDDLNTVTWENSNTYTWDQIQGSRVSTTVMVYTGPE